MLVINKIYLYLKFVYEIFQCLFYAQLTKALIKLSFLRSIKFRNLLYNFFSISEL
jgi:hypothetical protein